MIDRALFGAGLAFVAAQVRHRLSDVELEAFYAALAAHTDATEWREFARVAVVTHGWRYLPGVAELIEALRQHRGEPPLAAEAIAAYERVLAAAEWTAEGGATWSWRRIAEACGRAAADAYLEAGGQHAFARGWREAERREVFVAAYCREVREDVSARLLPAGTQRALLAPSRRQATDAEAGAILQRLLPAPKPRGPRLVEATEERLALLRRQAEEYGREPKEA